MSTELDLLSSSKLNTHAHTHTQNDVESAISFVSDSICALEGFSGNVGWGCWVLKKVIYGQRQYKAAIWMPKVSVVKKDLIKITIWKTRRRARRHAERRCEEQHKGQNENSVIIQSLPWRQEVSWSFVLLSETTEVDGDYRKKEKQHGSIELVQYYSSLRKPRDNKVILKDTLDRLT